jgi:hypothetical protein
MMSDKVEAKGRCLCGAVAIDVRSLSTSVGACHCTTCRRWGGGPYLAVACGSEVTFSGEDQIGIYNSSDWAERGFCKQCGTHLFYRLKASGEHFMPAGLFGDLEGYVLESQVFVDERPGFYEFANQTKDMTGAELFALYAPKD